MCFTGEEADASEKHAKPDEQEHDNKNDQGEELVETDLATQKGESQPIPYKFQPGS